MYNRAFHQRIHKLLQMLDGTLFEQAQCFFGGGTAIVLALGEYRESVDVDFLCASSEGYRLLRNVCYEKGLSGLFNQTPKSVRELRIDRYGIRTFVEIEMTPIKFEIVHEGRIQLSGEINPDWNIPVLSRNDMYAEKLLANTDRYNDISTANRDIIDLIMMIQGWGEIPNRAWEKAKMAYGESIEKAFAKAVEAISNREHLAQCLKKLHMDDTWLESILQILAKRKK